MEPWASRTSSIASSKRDKPPEDPEWYRNTESWANNRDFYNRRRGSGPKNRAETSPDAFVPFDPFTERSARPEDMIGHMDRVMRDMNSIMSTFMRSPFGPQDFGAMFPPEFKEHENRRQESTPIITELTDTDYDKLVSEKGIGSVVQKDIDGRIIPIEDDRLTSYPETRHGGIPGGQRSFFKSQIIQRTYDPSGKVQEVRKYRDSEGNQEQIIKRTIDGKTYTVTEKTTSDGREEHQEAFDGMDGADVNDFENKWSQNRQPLDYFKPNPDRQMATSEPLYDEVTRIDLMKDLFEPFKSIFKRFW